jgi:hypothetical protein
VTIAAKDNYYPYSEKDSSINCLGTLGLEKNQNSKTAKIKQKKKKVILPLENKKAGK